VHCLCKSTLHGKKDEHDAPIVLYNERELLHDDKGGAQDKKSTRLSDRAEYEERVKIAANEWR